MRADHETTAFRDRKDFVQQRRRPDDGGASLDFVKVFPVLAESELSAGILPSIEGDRNREPAVLGRLAVVVAMLRQPTFLGGVVLTPRRVWTFCSGG